MSDRFSSHGAGLESPASHAFAVTPSDASDLAETTRALYVGATGDIALVMKSGAAVTLTNVLAGSVLAVRAARVMATGTTAQDIVGLV